MNEFNHFEFNCILKLRAINELDISNIIDFFINNGFSFIGKTGVAEFDSNNYLYSDDYALCDFIKMTMADYCHLEELSLTFASPSNSILPHILVTFDIDLGMFSFNLAEGDFIDEQGSLEAESLTEIILFSTRCRVYLRCHLGT